MRELTNGIKQRFKLNTVGRSPSDIQRDLEQMGVKGFVVHMSPSRPTVDERRRYGGMNNFRVVNNQTGEEVELNGTQTISLDNTKANIPKHSGVANIKIHKRKPLTFYKVELGWVSLIFIFFTYLLWLRIKGSVSNIFNYIKSRLLEADSHE